MDEGDALRRDHPNYIFKSLAPICWVHGTQRSLARAKHTDIRLFIAQASENGATLGSVYRHLGILRQFYDFLNLGGVVDYVAPRFVRLRLPWHQRPRVLSEAQVRQLISATRTPRERALIEFFYSTGCRLNEARHIKIENIDFVARQARVRGKLRKLRLVLLAESASTAVRNYIGNRTIGYGLRRMLLTPARKPKQILEVGERKSISSERVTLVLGSPSEVECVRTIFNMFVTEKRSVADIARELNRRDIKNFSGRAWEYQGVNNILMHPKYAGFNVFNRTTRKLYTPTLLRISQNRRRHTRSHHGP